MCIRDRPSREAHREFLRGCRMEHGPWAMRSGDGPLVAVAVHAGHDLRADVADVIALDKQQRLLEEDPHTDGWTSVGDSGIVAHRSRFAGDLRRLLRQAAPTARRSAAALRPLRRVRPAHLQPPSRKTAGAAWRRSRWTAAASSP